MKSIFLLFMMSAAALQLQAQTSPPSGDFFPGKGEFVQLQRVLGEKSFSDPARLREIENGRLISDVGFRNYAQRVYEIENSSRLSVEIITLIDYRAAFSLLSILRTAAIEFKGLGDAHASDLGGILFCQGRTFVRLQGPGVGEALMSKVAESISNRIGIPDGKLPSLISYLPEAGMQIESLEYFPAIKAYETTRGVSLENSVAQRFEMEIARANYREGTSSGTLCLMMFPTVEMAEEYFKYLSSPLPESAKKSIYINRSGLLLSELEGSFPARGAGKILDLIQYGYSVQWIKDDRPQTTIVWGIPVQILNTTVNSFFFVLLLCIVCIVLGSMLAGLRILLRVYVPKNPLDDPERTEITRLKLS